MTPAQLSELIVATLQALAADGVIADPAMIPDRVTVERPRNREHGDWATNVAMQLGGRLGMKPREFAQLLADRLQGQPGISGVDVAGPGFINLRVDAAAAGALAKRIVDEGEAFGRNDSQRDKSIDLEFVSANPTGPLHIGHTRWAALGDSIARLLKASGANLVAEYYINDAGAQMNKFARSVLAAMRGEPTPEGGYPGAYIQDLAAYVDGEDPALKTQAEDEALPRIRELAYRRQLAEIRDSLDRFNVHFDVWFSELTLHTPDPETGKTLIDEAEDRLRAQGYVYEKDGATWVRTTAFGDDKDRVLTKADGEQTYFAADAAYYLNKKDRGYEEKIYLLGADHHGYIGRLKALAAAAGDDPETNITVLIGQLVNLNGAKLSKRAGNIIELDDLLAWIGADALRYWLARYPADSPLNLDGEQLRSRTNDNPVFYVQYAHARTHSVARNAADAGIEREAARFRPELLDHDTESQLIARLGAYEGTVLRAAELREPHRVARYLEELAADYHRWYDACRVIPRADEDLEDVHVTRLWLNDAVGQVLRNGLDLLGVSAPERM